MKGCSQPPSLNIYSDWKHAQNKQSREKHISSETIKDSAGNLYSELSWARQYLLPNWVNELNALTRSPCSVSRTCFNCKSKRLWYEMCWAGNDKAEQGQYSLLSFDRSKARYQRSRRNSGIFFLHSTLFLTLLNSIQQLLMMQNLNWTG